MTDEIFSFQFNHGGIQDQPNQRFQSDPFSLFEGWIAPQPQPQVSSDDHQFPFPSYEYHQIENQISVPQEISELDAMIHRQVLLNKPVTNPSLPALSELDELIYAQVPVSDQNPRISNFDSSSALFDLLRGATCGSRKLTLRERIDRETGKETLEESASFHKILMPPKECFLDFYEKVPFGKVSEFTAIQAVVDSVANATRIHIIDFNVKNGEQWTIFMQALVSREENPVDHLKITAIGTMGKDLLEETGKWLTGFAETMALSFSFKLIMVEDFMDLEEDMFEVDCNETVAILAEYILTTLISPIEKLDYVMKVMRHLNPCVMVVTEVESNQNSAVFVNRFIETLFYTSAFFDCLEVCMDRDSPHRTFAESRIFGQGVRIVVATEGEERVIRSVKMDTWRDYFRRSRMEEADLSFSCLYQAELVAKKFPSWRFCTVDMDRKSLIVRWKGTPIHSVTAWKFDNENE
ncbi:DELLA protein GAI1 [Linum perenne]